MTKNCTYLAFNYGAEPIIFICTDTAEFSVNIQIQKIDSGKDYSDVGLHPYYIKNAIKLANYPLSLEEAQIIYPEYFI